jgi:hypothetical protein
MRQMLAIALGSMLVLGCGSARGVPSDAPQASDPVAVVASPSAATPTATPQASVTPTPSLTPAPTPTPLPTDEPEVETPSPAEATERPTVPPFPAPPDSPTIAVDGGEGIVASQRGGCGGIWYLAEMVASDGCGPGGYEQAVSVDPIGVEPGVTMAIIAPADWHIGSDPALAETWTVRVAGTDGLDDGVETYAEFPGGRILDTGTAPRRVIRVEAPTRSGDYLLQLGSPMARDGFTFDGGRWYWHIRVP